MSTKAFQHVPGLIELTAEEQVCTSGGYSWGDFKRDAKDFWNSFKKGVDDALHTLTQPTTGGWPG